uniref:Uncharacterized protein n=1 Tax=Eutreptiella gymnastica TaxID=73025 RepID=A0A7S4CD67_9EUGL
MRGSLQLFQSIMSEGLDAGSNPGASAYPSTHPLLSNTPQPAPRLHNDAGHRSVPGGTLGEEQGILWGHSIGIGIGIGIGQPPKVMSGLLRCHSHNCTGVQHTSTTTTTTTTTTITCINN